MTEHIFTFEEMMQASGVVSEKIHAHPLILDRIGTEFCEPSELLDATVKCAFLSMCAKLDDFRKIYPNANEGLYIVVDGKNVKLLYEDMIIRRTAPHRFNVVICNFEKENYRLSGDHRAYMRHAMDILSAGKWVELSKVPY